MIVLPDCFPRMIYFLLPDFLTLMYNPCPSQYALSLSRGLRFRAIKSVNLTITGYTIDYTYIENTGKHRRTQKNINQLINQVFSG